MKQLSGLDATFLYLETPEMPMHVGALHLYELPAGAKGRFITAVRKHMAERMPLAPALRRRLWWMPLNLANPAWVDAVPDLRQHIVEVRLPKGAGLAELEAEVSRLHPVLLDRSRPLWKFHVFEGLAPGANGLRRAAIYTQLHHAAVDGQAAVALANAILDTTPAPREVSIRPSRRVRVFRLEMTEMLRGVLGNQVQKLSQIVRKLPATVGTLKDALATALSHTALFGGSTGNVTLAPRTALNASVTSDRAFACVSVPLTELKEVGRAFDATVNDMVLMLCSTALRRYFSNQRALPRKSLVAAVPITLRDKGDASPDNQASMSLISLGTHLADPARRLAHIRAATLAMKATMGSLKSVLPTDYPSLGVPWLIEAATALYGKARVAERIPLLANLVISNVPGPPLPLYMAGAKMLTNYPTSIVVHGLGLNITVQSYDGSLDFGLMADARAMPDVRALADAITIAFDDLRALARPGAPDAASGAGTVRRLAGDLSDAVTTAMGRMARQVVSTALETAVSQVTGKPKAEVASPRRRGSRGRARGE
jgi:WS/DGAT/MGAT family acyltransferase